MADNFQLDQMPVPDNIEGDAKLEPENFNIQDYAVHRFAFD